MGYTPLASIKTLWFATITNVIGSAVDFISALLGNYYEFFYAVNMCFKSNVLFIRLGYCL